MGVEIARKNEASGMMAGYPPSCQKPLKSIALVDN